MRIRAEALTAGTLGGFALDDPGVVLLGRETTLRDGGYAGYLTSEGFGYTVGRPVDYSYVRNAEGATEQWVRNGRYELVVAGERLPAQVHFGPLYDPDGARFRL